MKKKPIVVAISGATGNVASSLYPFLVSKSDLFGRDSYIELRLVDTEGKQHSLYSLVMEHADCACSGISQVRKYSDPSIAFQGADWVILIGGSARKNGIDRSALLEQNGPIFKEYGRALNGCGNSNVRVLVVANPANTNTLIAAKNAPTIHPSRFFSLMMLDANRIKAACAERVNLPPCQFKRVVAWGNHSATVVPDWHNMRIAGKTPTDHRKVDDCALRWFHSGLFDKVRNRGSEIIHSRGKSSALSAAKAIIDTLCSFHTPTPEDDCIAAGAWTGTDGVVEYDIPGGLYCGLPGRVLENGTYEIIRDFHYDDFLRTHVDASIQELLVEGKQAQQYFPE